MKGYSVEEVAKIIRGKFLQKDAGVLVTHLLLDSRKINHPEASVFFALKGARRNGHHFISDLYDRGLRVFVVSEEVPLLPEATFIKVKDTVTALQSLAAHHRTNFRIPVVGITGSNGKTIVKEWLYQLLSPDFNIVRSPKSYNSQIGVPLSVWQMEDYHDLALFEAGISQPDEMANLARVIQPTIGIFTNIGKAHGEGFLNIRQKINEKLKLFMHAEVILLCRDYLDINECIVSARGQMKKADQSFEGFKTFSWSRQNLDADVQVKETGREGSYSRIVLEHEGTSFEYSIPFTDDASIENAINAWMLCRYLRVDPEQIALRMPDLHSVAMRLELNDAINNCSLINDSYNSDLNSLAIALDFLKQQKQHESKTVILSDILQSGMNDLKLYGDVNDLLRSHRINRLFGIGPALRKQQAVFEKDGALTASFYPSTDEFLAAFSNDWFHNETILLKGARKFEFERIGKRLQQKAHETILEIDLNALVHNLAVYQSLLDPNTRIMVMVKAFSYGSGSYEIANALQFHKVDYLAVAYADEGAELRKAGINSAIMVMNPEVKSFESMVHFRLEPELYSLRLLNQFVQHLASATTGFNGGYPVHLELETGMNRLGFGMEDLDELLNVIGTSGKIRVVSVFTHLAASEDPSLDHFTQAQVHRFSMMSERIAAALSYPVLRHLVNSAGIARFKAAHFDMVRLGIGLYGIDSSGQLKDRLRNVSTLKTTVSQIKRIKAGESVGYSRAAVATRDMTIATVGIGYADGLNRSLSRGAGRMSLKGVLCPVVGNICMDMTMIDISAVPDPEEGDEVIIFGNELPVEQVAEWAGTIPYEVISTISRRVKRVYFHE